MDYVHSCYLPAAGTLTSTYPGINSHQT
jgi:hypothetical protein